MKWLAGLLNPWVLLGLLVVLGASFTAGQVIGTEQGKKRIQGRWDAQVSQQKTAALAQQERNRVATAQLQETADTLRTKNEAAYQIVSAQLAAATRELSKRPARPAPGAVVPATGCIRQNGTGADLYAEDAALVIGEAARADRLRIALIACYSQYDDTRAVLKNFSSASRSPSAATDAPTGALLP